MKEPICPACMNDANEQGDEVWCIRSNDYFAQLCIIHESRNIFIEHKKALLRTSKEFAEILNNASPRELFNMNLKEEN